MQCSLALLLNFVIVSARFTLLTENSGGLYCSCRQYIPIIMTSNFSNSNCFLPALARPVFGRACEAEAATARRINFRRGGTWKFVVGDVVQDKDDAGETCCEALRNLAPGESTGTWKVFSNLTIDVLALIKGTRGGGQAHCDTSTPDSWNQVPAQSTHASTTLFFSCTAKILGVVAQISSIALKDRSCSHTATHRSYRERERVRGKTVSDG